MVDWAQIAKDVGAPTLIVIIAFGYALAGFKAWLGARNGKSCITDKELLAELRKIRNGVRFLVKRTATSQEIALMDLDEDSEVG